MTDNEEMDMATRYESLQDRAAAVNHQVMVVVVPGGLRIGMQAEMVPLNGNFEPMGLQAALDRIETYIRSDDAAKAGELHRQLDDALELRRAIRAMDRDARHLISVTRGSLDTRQRAILDDVLEKAGRERERRATDTLVEFRSIMNELVDRAERAASEGTDPSANADVASTATAETAGSKNDWESSATDDGSTFAERHERSAREAREQAEAMGGTSTSRQGSSQDL